MEEKILSILNSGCFEIVFMDKIPYIATGTTPFYGSKDVVFIGSDATTVHNNISKETRDKIVTAVREILINSKQK
jgi:hypothetical protein